MLKLPQGTEKCYFRCNPSSLCRLTLKNGAAALRPLSSAHKGYPQALMANEVQVQLNGTKKRCDTVLYRRDLYRPDDCGIQGA